MQREITAGRVAMHRLRSGNREAYEHVHIEGLLHLVVNPTAPCVETVPETLLLDVRGMKNIQRQVEFIITASAMLATTHRALISSTDTEHDTLIIDAILNIFNDPDCYLLDIETVAEKITAQVRSAHIADAAKAELGEALRRCANIRDPLHNLMRKRVKSYLEQALKNPRVLPESCFKGLVKFLTPMLASVAQHVWKIYRVNCRVHGQRCYRMMAVAAASMEREAALF